MSYDSASRTLTLGGTVTITHGCQTIGYGEAVGIYSNAELHIVLADGAVVNINMKNYARDRDLVRDLETSTPLTGRCYGDFKPGSRTHLHNIPAICGSGFAFATACYQDIENDANALNQPDTTWDTGVRKALEDELPHTQWGCIGAWAWGESRIMDALALIPAIDPRKVFFSGLSRHGKATLWADPQGEFLGLREACPVYGLYGLGGLENAPYPKPYGYVWGGNVGFQLRTGDHSSTPFEWYGYIQFLKRCLAGQTDVTARNLWD